jgi:hypothetical protein
VIQDTIDKIKASFNRRKYAYQMVFDRNNKYLHVVLKDLAKFCRAHESTYHSDARVHAVAEGRREVWLRISDHLNLSVDELYDLHKVKEMGETKK